MVAAFQSNLLKATVGPHDGDVVKGSLGSYILLIK